MKPGSMILQVILSFMLLTLCGCAPFKAAISDSRKPATGIYRGQIAPDFQISTAQEMTITLSQYRGQPVLVNFFATWCGPCRAEMPAMQNVYQRYWSQGLAIIAVDQDESAEIITNFGSEYGLTFPITLDPNNRVGRFYRVNSIPRSFFIDSNGVIQKVQLGSMEEEEIDQAVAALFNIPLDPALQPPTQTPEKPTSTPRAAKTPPAKAQPGTIVESCVTVKAALLRRGPGQGFPASGQMELDRCAPFDAFSEDGTWLRLAGDGSSNDRLWIKAEYITLKENGDGLPVVK